MTESKHDKSNARPDAGRAFLSDKDKSSRRRLFLHRMEIPSLTAHLIFWPVTVAGITLDLWTKKAVFEWLYRKPSGSVSIIDGFLNLVMAENAGAAFGIASGQRYLLTSVSVVALIVIFGVFLLGGIKQRLINVALGLFAAGVCGNLWDRIFNEGTVRDFIDVYYRQYRWPAFNIADSMLCIAVGLLIISSLRMPKRM